MREKLSNRRRSRLINFEHEHHVYILQYALYPDGRIAELFLDVGPPAKPGDMLDSMARDLATLTSIALQHGISVDEILTSLSQELNGTMRGPLGKALSVIKQDLEDEKN